MPVTKRGRPFGPGRRSESAAAGRTVSAISSTAASARHAIPATLTSRRPSGYSAVSPQLSPPAASLREPLRSAESPRLDTLLGGMYLLAVAASFPRATAHRCAHGVSEARHVVKAGYHPVTTLPRAAGTTRSRPTLASTPSRGGQ